MVVGAFGPWGSVADLVTVHGTDGGGDGWVVIGTAGIAVIALVFYVRRQRAWLPAIPLLAGLAGAATTAYDLSNVNELASNELFGSIVSAEWGIYAALVGSISLALSSIGLLIERRRASRISVELAAEA